MKKSFIAFLLACVSFAATTQAQDDTALHRKVYAEIEGSVGKMKETKVTMEVDGLGFELRGWNENGELKKIVARVPGEDGDGSEEYYIHGGAPIFVFRHYAAAAPDGKKGAQVEDRFYLKDGVLFKWLGSDKQPVSPKAEEFKFEGERLAELGKLFIAAFDKKPVAAVAADTTGVFLGIEEGDYAHWRMKDAKGNELSFFILKPEPSVEAVLENPEKFVGRACQVTWTKSMEDIPEAGGKMEIEQVFGVKWLEK
jgi:hypothetical protein